MAKFNAPLEDRDTSYRSIGPVERSGSGGEIAQLLSTGMKMYGAYADRQAAIAEQNDKIKAVEAANAFEAAKGNALTRVEVARVEEEDRVLKQQLEYQKIQADSQLLYQGGLQENEIAILADLQKQAARLDSLDPRQRQLRKNALYKKALTDYGDLGIQQEIGALFGKANNYQEPEMSAQDKAIAQELDNTYGPGQWGAVEKGQLVAKQVQLERITKQAKMDASSMGVNAVQGAYLTGSKIMERAVKSITDKGSINDQEKAQFKAQLALTRNLAIQQIDAWANEHFQNGVDVTDDVKIAKEKVNASYDSMENMFSGEGAFGDALSTQRVWENTKSILKNINETAYSPLADALGGTMASGDAGKFESAMKLLNQPNGVLEQFRQQNPHLAGSVNELRTQLLEYINVLSDPMTVEKGYRAGVIDQGVAGIYRKMFSPEISVAGAGIGIQSTTNPNDQVRFMDDLEKFSRPGDVVKKLEALTTPQASAKLKLNAKDPVIQKRIQGTAKSSMEQVLVNRNQQMLKLIEVDRQGNLVLKKNSGMQGGLGKAEANIFESQELRALNNYLNTFDIELGGKEVAVKEFLKLRDDYVNPKVNETTADEQ